MEYKEKNLEVTWRANGVNKSVFLLSGVADCSEEMSAIISAPVMQIAIWRPAETERSPPESKGVCEERSGRFLKSIITASR